MRSNFFLMVFSMLAFNQAVSMGYERLTDEIPLEETETTTPKIAKISKKTVLKLYEQTGLKLDGLSFGAGIAAVATLGVMLPFFIKPIKKLETREKIYFLLAAVKFYIEHKEKQNYEYQKAIKLIELHYQALLQQRLAPGTSFEQFISRLYQYMEMPTYDYKRWKRSSRKNTVTELLLFLFYKEGKNFDRELAYQRYAASHNSK